MRITRDRIVYSLDKRHAPVAVVDPGAEILFETWDARTGSIRSERDFARHAAPQRPQPRNRPGSYPGGGTGDSIVVHILDIALATGGTPGRGRGRVSWGT